MLRVLQKRRTADSRQGGGRNQVTTGDDGTYSFTNVNPGQYQVVVDRDGFITQEYGQRSWVSGTGATLTLPPDRNSPTSMCRWFRGHHRGKIRDETGEAMAGIQVRLCRISIRTDRKLWCRQGKSLPMIWGTIVSTG
jgi:hypothetical protein